MHQFQSSRTLTQQQDAIAGSQQELQEQFCLRCAYFQGRRHLHLLVWCCPTASEIDYERRHSVYDVRAKTTLSLSVRATNPLTGTRKPWMLWMVSIQKGDTFDGEHFGQ